MCTRFLGWLVVCLSVICFSFSAYAEWYEQLPNPGEICSCGTFTGGTSDVRKFYLPEDAHEHEIITCRAMICNLCDKYIGNNNGAYFGIWRKGGKATQSHYDMSDGVEDGLCICGYRLTADCQHNQVTDIYSHSTYSQNNAKHHIVTAVYNRTCKDCGKSLGLENGASQNEAHTFNNGVCVCGYSQSVSSTVTPRPTATPRPNVPSGDHNCTYSSETKKTYYQHNDTQHWEHTEIKCYICGKDMYVRTPDGPKQDHTYSNGKCTVCGYAAGYYLSVDQGHINGLIAHVTGGQGATINVTSNVDWTVTEDLSWVTVHNITGKGDGSFTVYVEANNGYAREGTIAVYGAPCDTIYIKIKQEGAVADPATCEHVYGYDYADATDGEWQSVNDDYHKRVTLLYKDVCTLCGDVRYQRRADEAAVQEKHTWGKTNWAQYHSDENEHWRIGKCPCTALGCDYVDNVFDPRTAHVFDTSGYCKQCKYFDSNAAKKTYTIDQINDEIEKFAEYVGIANGYAKSISESAYSNKFQEISVLLFTKGTGALTYEAELAFTNNEVEALVETFVLAEMAEIEYISNAVFTDFDSWLKEQGIDDYTKVLNLIKKYTVDGTVDKNKEKWLDDILDKIKNDVSKNDGESDLQVYYTIQELNQRFELVHSGVGTASSFLSFVSAMQNNTRTLEMRAYMQNEAYDRLEALKAGFTDERIIGAINEYQSKINNMFLVWAIDNTYDTLKDGKKTYGSYCHLTKKLQENGIIKHIPEGANEYLKAEEAFKDYKIGGKFAVKDILAGAKAFDTIAGFTNLLFDADGFVEMIDTLKVYSNLINSEKSIEYAYPGEKKADIRNRLTAIAALGDGAYAAVDKVCDACIEMCNSGIMGVLMDLGGLSEEDYNAMLQDEVRCAQNRQKLADELELLLEMIDNCPDLID